ENRFTYRQKGLTKLLDLGEFWEKETGAPIPLGGIIFRNDQAALAAKVNRLIRKSLEYAFAHYPALPDFVKSNSQEMDEAVMRQHIDLYVNNYSLTLGLDGENAIHTLLRTFARLHPREQTRSLSIIH
ncbi:MAG TPA: MqnA/MqnD/SBP family protein, partial [Puia sp.]|nr:MqnA/MqnD/SBP family protein [Puia sp.]